MRGAPGDPVQACISAPKSKTCAANMAPTPEADTWNKSTGVKIQSESVCSDVQGGEKVMRTPSRHRVERGFLIGYYICLIKIIYFESPKNWISYTRMDIERL